MRIDEKNGNHLIAEDGKVLRRISDESIAGREIWLGYTYYLNGEKLSTPFEELPEHYEEVDAPEEVVEVRPEEYETPEGDVVLLDEEHPMVVESETVTEDGRPEGAATSVPKVITVGDVAKMQEEIERLKEVIKQLTTVSTED